MFAELWMVGVRRMPRSNQNTQANIESYHGALKCWFALDTKSLKGRRIDWLVWRLTTTIVPLHAHIGNEKKRFHKKQGYGGHYYTKCGKGNPYSTHPCVPTNP